MKTKLLLLLFSIFSFGQNEIIIKNINIISMTNQKVDMNSILIKNGKIIAIKPFDKIKTSKNATIINGENKYLMPSLADMHVHLPKINQMDSIIQYNLKAGVTKIRVMDSEDDQSEIKKSIQNKIKPKFYYSVVLTKDTKLSDIQIDSIIKKIKVNNFSLIKVKSLPNEENFNKLLDYATKNNILVCGHYPSYIQFGKAKKIDLEKVFKSNFRSIEHLGGFDSFEENQLKQAMQLSKERNTFNCPTSDWEAIAYGYLNKNDLQNRFTYKTFKNQFGSIWDKSFDKYMTANGGEQKFNEAVAPYKPYIEKKRNLLKSLSSNGNLLLIGSDPSNYYQLPGYSVYEEMFQWSKIGIDNFTILQSATINAAKFFKEEKQWGTVEIGKEADLIILTKNPLKDINNITTIEKTILAGKILN